MKHLYRKFAFIFFALALTTQVFAQSYATKVFEFKPAPGQFTNSGLADPGAASGVLGRSDYNMISLGGFGGYVVVGFDQPIKNDPHNPYGVDFTVIANGFPGWAEPGAVMVMKDTNGNGLPDDTWYELAGSEYYFRNSRNVTTTYFNPHYTVARDVRYQTDLGETGAVLTNIFNIQPYYPIAGTFTNIGADQESYSGRRISVPVNRSNPTYITAPGLAFGYADNKSNNSNPTVPLNPYYDDGNGSADGFDLSWAVDAEGNHVNLTDVDFVKIYNPGQADAGWLGEISTEVECIAVTTPDPVWEAKDYFLNVIGTAPLQILKGKSYTFEGKLFKNGIPQNTPGTWSVSDESVASIDQQGKFTAIENGVVTVQYTAGENTTPAAVDIEVIELVGVDLTTNIDIDNGQKIYAHEEVYVHAEDVDNREPGWYVPHYAYDTYTYTVDDPNLADVSAAGKVTLKAAGVVTITATSVINTSLSKSIQLTIEAAPEVKIKQNELAYTIGVTSKQVELNQLFGVDGGQEIVSQIKSNSNTRLAQAAIRNNQSLDLSFGEGVTGQTTVTIATTAYGVTKDIPITIQVSPETGPGKYKRVIFVNGGQFGSATGNVQVYYPTENKVEKLADFKKAQSVQDLLIDDRYAYVSAEYDLIKYDIVSKQQVAIRHLQDLSPTEADGGGADAYGLNHTTVFYKDWIVASRQNSAMPPQDGYNVRIYKKSDLSLVKKIPVSTQAAGIVIVGDSAFVALNGGFQSNSGQLAIIDLVNLEKKEEYNFGTDGGSIMQLYAKDKQLYILGQEKMLTYDIKNHTHQYYPIGIGHYDFSSTLLTTAIIDNRLYGKYNWGAYAGENKGFGVIDLDTKTVVNEDLIHLNIDPDLLPNGLSLMASAYDPEEEKFYFTFGQWWGGGMGRVYNKDGSLAGSFDHIEDSPERIAVSTYYTNQLPYVSKKLQDITLHKGETFSANLGDYFRDDDGEGLSYTLSVAGGDLPVWITRDADVVTIKADPSAPVDPVTLTIKTSDVGGGNSIQSFRITVIPDQAPVVVKPIESITFEEHASTQTLSLAGVFEDVDDDASEMTYAITENTNSGLVAASIEGDQLNLNITPGLYGEAQVTVQATSGGKTASTTFAISVKEKTVTGIPETIASIKIYPNPVSDVLHITLIQSGGALLQIIKPDGTKAISQELKGAENTIDVTTLSPAVYIITVEQGSRKLTQKIVKQ